ncbi:hypothetical protein FSP39_014696 [Pinctada imbricata]|uniref:Uncharacterized protein n=1 Tax=Pinctada imbricata TaxID=66713 RepID=A0AA88Y3V4_PINIB|nr:hypothetical protein FSP39_014696 [Pinctada imbricata]
MQILKYFSELGYMVEMFSIEDQIFHTDEDIAPGVGIFKIISNDKANVEMIRIQKIMKICYKLLYYLIGVTYNIAVLNGYEETVFLGSNCPYEIHKVYEDKTYKVVWTGAEPGPYGCKVSFMGQNPDDISDEYQVCIEVGRFYLRREGIQVNFHYDSVTNTPAKIYTTYDYPSKFCGNEDELVGISVTTDEFRDVDTSDSYFTFKITAIKTYNNVDIGAIIGGVVGGIALLAFLCACCCCSSKRNKSETPGAPAATNLQPIPTQAGYTGGASQPGNYPHRYGEYSQLPQQHPPPTGYSGNVPLTAYPHQQPHSSGYPVDVSQTAQPNTSYPVDMPLASYPSAPPQGYNYPQYPPSAEAHQNFNYPVGGEQPGRLEASAPPPSYEEVTRTQ